MIKDLVTTTAGRVDAWDLLFVIAVLAALAGWYWWSRKATKHPEYAARRESELDATLAKTMHRLGFSDEQIARAVGVDLVAAGQDTYAQLKNAQASFQARYQAAVEELQVKAAEYSAAQELVAKLRAIAGQSSAPPPPPAA